jgi:hypothetical protein
MDGVAETLHNSARICYMYCSRRVEDFCGATCTVADVLKTSVALHWTGCIDYSLKEVACRYIPCSPLSIEIEIV